MLAADPKFIERITTGDKMTSKMFDNVPLGAPKFS